MRLSRHAEQRMAEMGVSRNEVWHTMRSPVMRLPDPKPDRTRLVGEKVIVVQANDGRVVTVLWKLNGSPEERHFTRPEHRE